MFGEVCDTVDCQGVPVARCRRRFVPRNPKTGGAQRHRDGRPVVVTTDKELCAECFEEFERSLAAPETIFGERQPLTTRRAG